MSRNNVTAYIETEVDVDLDDIAEEDLIDYLEDKGYVIKEGESVSEIEDLYYDWLSLPPDAFNKVLKKFFSEQLDKIVV